MTATKSVRAGAVNGVLAFIVFGIVEAIFADVLPWVAGWSAVLEWQTTALLLAIYAVAGLVLGALSGLTVYAIGRPDSEAAFRAAAALTVITPYTANVLRQHELMLMALPLAAALIASAGPILSVRGGAWGGRTRPLASYWTVAFVLVGVPSISKEVLWHYSGLIRVCGAAAFLGGILTVSYITRNFRLRPAWVAALALAVPALCFVLDERIQLPGPDALGPSKASGKPNIVLLVMDTVRADHLSLYGYARKTTPHLEKFARKSTLYMNAISGADMTLASHASIFTGMYPSWHQAHYAPGNPMGRPLAPGFRTLAEVLADGGYLTMGVGANTAYLQPAYALNQGFSFWTVRPGFFFEKDAFYLRQSVRSLIRPLMLPHFGMNYRRAERINADAFHMLDAARHAKRPFFLFINYMDAHWPYNPPPPFDHLFPSPGPPLDDLQYTSLLREVMTGRRSISESERQRLISQYDGGVAYLDSEIAKLIGRLKALGMYENTLLIVTSDHGETFGERHMLGHGVSTYQEQVHVPLIIKYPNSSRAAVVTEPVSGVDLMPTVLELTGDALPAGVQGESLLNVDTAKRDVIAESYPSYINFEFHRRFGRVERAVFEGSRKLITSTAGKHELYDIAHDPGETSDLFAAEKAFASDLQARLDRSLQKMVAAGSLTRSGTGKGLNKGDVDRLKSLGYVQ